MENKKTNNYLGIFFKKIISSLILNFFQKFPKHNVQYNELMLTREILNT